jgi:addiction module RelE/StbE family toxin
MRIRGTDPAVRDLTHICDYIHDHDAPAAALRVTLIIYQAVASLSEFPNRGRSGRRPNTRELVFPDLPFLAIYRIRGDVVEVVRILHGAQKWP